MKDVLLRIELLLTRILESSEVNPSSLDVSKQDVWLDGVEVKALLHIGDMTLFRRRTDGTFKCKKIGKKWFYAKSTL
ncbi:MAG: hypothetical protein WKF66_10265 [Pedobacter sp.]